MRASQSMASVKDGDRLDDILRGYRMTQLIHVVVKLGVPDHLARGPMTAAELAKVVDASEGALTRLLNALSTTEILTFGEDGRFALGRDGHRLRSDVPNSFRSQAIMYGESWWWRAWGDLYGAVCTGETAFDRVHGANVWEWFDRHRQDDGTFSRLLSE